MSSVTDAYAIPPWTPFAITASPSSPVSGENGRCMADWNERDQRACATNVVYVGECIGCSMDAEADKAAEKGCELISHFQPICSVKSRSIVGLEALTRGVGAEGQLIPPSQLFAEALRNGLAVELEGRCRQMAMASFSQQQAGRKDLLLFLNLDLSLSAGRNDAANLACIARRWTLSPSSVVVEVLESQFDNTEALAATVNDFRRHGFLVALDDMGAGHSNLDRVVSVRPDVIKVDRQLIRNIDADRYRQAVFKALVHLGRHIGALIVAEGVETRTETLTVLELGADLLQGYYLGRPASLAHLCQADVGVRVQTLADDFKQHMVQRVHRQNLRQRHYELLLESMLPLLKDCSVEAFDRALEDAIQAHPTIECMYLLDKDGIQVSSTVCHPSLEFRRSRGLFRPAPRGTDHSLKDYYYLLLNVERQQFVTAPYVSMATGSVCRTISCYLRNEAVQRSFILCADIGV